MEVVYYTLVAAGLYFMSDWLLDRIEILRGERLQYRSVIFFAIILALALLTSTVINFFVPALQNTP
ncbi:MAG: hypothetical protein K2P67_01135 [Gallionellaceae bacterium]|nr:hypothetical protein [Gallionellaceae bacterium]